jgi:hypothetical protein
VKQLFCLCVGQSSLHISITSFLGTHITCIIQLLLNVLNALPINATTGNLSLTQEFIDIPLFDLTKSTESRGETK